MKHPTTTTSPTRLDAAVRETLHAAGLRPLTYRWTLAVETIQPDGTVTQSLLHDCDVDERDARDLLVHTAQCVGAADSGGEA